MTDPADHVPVRRSDWRAALACVTERRARTVLIVIFLALAGIASALGLLRWTHPFARWSFAAVSWSVACIVLAVAVRKTRQNH